MSGLLVVGLDLSMTGTGVATGTGPRPHTFTIKTKDGERDRRLSVIRDQVAEAVSGAYLAVLEGPVVRFAGAAIQVGMVHGVVRQVLLDQGIPYGVIPPSSLKKFATGKGAATKVDMALSAFKRDGGAEFKDDNQCDAYWLWHMARTHLARPVLDLPKVQTGELKNLIMEGKGRP